MSLSRREKETLPAPGELTALETETIALFLELSRMLGLPRSVAEIYGLLFISPRPLSMEDLIERLQLSKGSASQGLKILRNLGAIRGVYVAGTRRDHYEAEMELRRLVAGFLKEQVQPHLESGFARLPQLENLLAEAEPEQKRKLGGRMDKLRQWEKNSRQLLPLVQRFLGK